MNTLFLGLAFVLVLVLSVSYGTAMARVMSLRVREARGPRRIDPADAPIDELLCLQEAGAELEALGFQRVAVVEEDLPFEGAGSPDVGVVYLDRDARSLAVFSMLGGPSRWQAFQVSFLSFAAGGAVLETVSHAAHAMPLPVEGHHLVDAQTVSLREQWERHQKEVSEHRSFVSTLIDADRGLGRLRQVRQAAFRGQVERGELAAASAGQGYRYTARGALAAIRRASGGEGQRLRAHKTAEKRAVATAKSRGLASGAAEPAPRSDVTPELVFFRRRSGIDEVRSSGWQMKLLFFAVSMALFAVAFGIKFSMSTVVILIGALFFHELGHALAMRAFGYRDLQILFIPFLGAVASGRKQHTKPLEEIVVLLAGPMPGIAVGTLIVVMGWGNGAEWIHQTAVMLLILNFLNLLPIVPLDGGRVMNIVLFDRFPSLQLGFAALSAAGLALAGRMMNDHFLFGIGIALIVGLPTQLRQNRLLLAARRSLRATGEADELGTGLDDDAPLRAIFAELLKPHFDSWNSETRYQLVRQLGDRLSRRPAGWRIALVGTTAYALCFAVPFGTVSTAVYLEARAQQEAFDAEYTRSVDEWNARIADAAGDAERAKALYDAGLHFSERGFAQDAHGHLLEAAALLAGGASPEIEANTHLLLGQIYPHWTGVEEAEALIRTAEEHLAKALVIRERLHGPESLEVAEVLEVQWETKAAYPKDALPLELRLLAIYETLPEDHPERARKVVESLQAVSSSQLATGDFEAGMATMERAVAFADEWLGEEHASRHQDLLDRLTKVYFAGHRYDDVAVLLARREAMIAGHGNELDYARPSLDEDRAWLAYWRGDYAEAWSAFQDLGAQAEAEAEEARVGIFGANLVAVPHLMSQAVAAARSGDERTAVELLGRTRDLLEDEGESLPDYLEGMRPPDDTSEFHPGVDEYFRRQSEKARVLFPLVAAL
ncbi:MAG: hypothetical protein QNK04_10710 [Myxococcota bacterium]|nr:hypothetical protein [Myxococcota bacterium]